jgi:hypothetical protein
MLVPTDLVPYITAPVDGQPDLGGKHKEAGKISFLESEMLWFIGNIPELSNHCEIFANLKPTPAPLLEFRPAIVSQLPVSLDDWRDAQADDNELLEGIGESAWVTPMSTSADLQASRAILEPTRQDDSSLKIESGRNSARARRFGRCSSKPMALACSGEPRCAMMERECASLKGPALALAPPVTSVPQLVHIPP